MATHMTIPSQLYQKKNKMETNISQVRLTAAFQSFVGKLIPYRNKSETYSSFAFTVFSLFFII